MKAVIKWRYIIFGLWIVAAVALTMTAPQMSDLIRTKGQVGVPDGYTSSNAYKMLEEKNGKQKEMSISVVFHEKKPFTKQQLAKLKRDVTELKEKEDLGVVTVTTHLTDETLTDKLLSKDKKTMIVALSVDKGKRTVAEVRDELKASMKSWSVKHYLTASSFIDEDVIQSSQEGVKKTEVITVIFILTVLFFVFRSAIAPIVPLVSVGFAYVVAQAVVSVLVDKMDFPLSNFTQTFIVAVLFGVGTDYCILLLSRFKEELGKTDSIDEAIVTTYKTAGRTVIYSALAVLVGFASIGFAEFKLYKSASAVAIGVFFLMFTLLTIVPFFMKVLGKKLFWPMTKSIEHKESVMYRVAGQFSMKRPVLTLLLIAGAALAVIVPYNNSLSFNSLDEIGDEYESVKAFNIISDAFGPGELMPVQVVIETTEKLDNSGALAAVERVSREIEKVKTVDYVRSATRPVGEELSDLQVVKQVEQLNDGIGKGNDGIGKIRDGLNEAASGLKKSEPQLAKATDGFDVLIDGTTDLQTGLEQLTSGLSQLEQGVSKGSLGAKQLAAGLKKAARSAQQLANGSAQLAKGYTDAQKGISQIAGGYSQINTNLSNMQKGLASLATPLANLKAKMPSLQADPDFVTIEQTVLQVSGGLAQLTATQKDLTAKLSGAAQGLATANANLTKLVKGQQQLTAGLNQLATGLSQLAQGLDQAAAGQKQIVDQMPALTDGVAQLNDGQVQLKDGIGQFVDQIGQLSGGLKKSADGLTKVNDGLTSAQTYLADLSSASDKELAGFYIPEEALTSKDFKRLLDVYMSKDRELTTIDVVLNVNPYSNGALNEVDKVKAAVERGLNETKFADAKVGIAGVSSIYNDLNQISQQDFAKTVTYMLIGIFLILLFLLRSVVMPIYLVGSLVVTYYMTVGITEIIFVDIFGYAGLNWAVPFFGFVILMALGIDYSIFLMDRFNEYTELPVKEAMIKAMENMGTVIISAVIILAGTFAAMYPSGVLSLLQIATIILVGLLLYAFIFLPLFVPVMVNLLGKANWWPFIRKK